VKILNHLVFILNVLFDPRDVLRSLTKILLFSPVFRLFCLFSCGKNVFDGIGDDKIFVRFESMNRFLVNPGNRVLLMPTVIGEIAD